MHKEHHNFKKPIDIVAHYYVKIVSFAAYLSLIVIVSCSSAYLQGQVEGEIKGEELEELKTEPTPVVVKEVYIEQEPHLDSEYNTDIVVEAEETQADIAIINKNTIALIIDDCGVNEKNTKIIVDNFPKEITLSYLPYAKNIQAQVDAGIAQGHEIMLHLPMEAINYNEVGSNTLELSWDDSKLLEQTKVHLDTFKGYSSVNNHTGSKFTQNEAKMRVVLQELKDRDIPFLDSLTISNSVAHKTAKDMEMHTAKRNIFIDHVPSVEHIYNQLLKAEDISNATGSAIVIGHPRDTTIKALKLWLPTLEDKDIVLIPASSIYK
jgi:polysaccharide deacetylase 2 family uncharacterized protein YibQ